MTKAKGLLVSIRPVPAVDPDPDDALKHVCSCPSDLEDINDLCPNCQRDYEEWREEVARKHRPFDYCLTCGVPIRKGSTFCSYGCARITWSRPNSSQPEEVTLPAA
jgi:hypothetical protein